MTIAYVANHGVHIGAAQNINLARALGLGAAGYPKNIAFSEPRQLTSTSLAIPPTINRCCFN